MIGTVVVPPSNTSVLIGKGRHPLKLFNSPQIEMRFERGVDKREGL